MQLDLCCSTPDLIWRTRPVGKRFADQYACTCCDTVHRTEQWFAPFAWKSRSDCINCGAPGQAYGTCSRCQSTLTKTLTLHHKLIRLHPDLDPCKGAQIAFDAGRSLLCLKLATISLYQNPQSVPARLLLVALRWFPCFPISVCLRILLLSALCLLVVHVFLVRRACLMVLPSMPFVGTSNP